MSEEQLPAGDAQRAAWQDLRTFVSKQHHWTNSDTHQRLLPYVVAELKQNPQQLKQKVRRETVVRIRDQYRAQPGNPVLVFILFQIVIPMLVKWVALWLYEHWHKKTAAGAKQDAAIKQTLEDLYCVACPQLLQEKSRDVQTP